MTLNGDVLCVSGESDVAEVIFGNVLERLKLGVGLVELVKQSLGELIQT